MARDLDNGICLTDEERTTCVTCAHGKQRRNNQLRKDTGRKAPIGKVGGVICSDIKGPITPADRLGNRIHCLRTDGGSEHKVVDPFCKSEGVCRQISEADNQVSNGKAERMHQTIMDMVRSMIFGSQLPLSFWGDAAEYTAYTLNRSPSQGNIGRALPIEVLTGHKALDRRGEERIIIGKNEENIKTLSEETNERLIRQIDDQFETETGEEKTSSTCDDVGNREESQAKTQKRKRCGKRGGQARRLSQKGADRTDVTSPGLGMATGYGGKKPQHARLLGRCIMKILLVRKLQ
uniref:GagPol polyprotein putative n=1 Tax=Albugo laibachii Nc14 TaxID=890382 RepID=F0X1B9_9STRA|nr:GagPol polyprotein putative [Albugo laibachii Nc14]|eukprot:CCA27595.1 GagPol polyprotein putative [Albugo laibachii Nc14]